MLCTVEGCGQTHKARGYCGNHYTRWRKHGNPLVSLYPGRKIPKNAAGLCAIEACPRTGYGLGLCRLHYYRVLRFGSTDLPVREPQFCSECDQPAHARGLCQKHVGRLYRLGTTELPVKPTDAERFWAKVPVGDVTECWEWQGSRHPHGHGYAVRDGKVVYAHRYSLELALGRSLPVKAMACHHCDNPPCVNPAHLYEGDAQSNVDDMWRRGRANPGRRKQDGAA